MPHVNNKPLARNGKFGPNKKLGLEWTMNRLVKPFKKPIQKIEKTVKIKVKLPHPSEKANFCSNTVFSLYSKWKST